MERMYYKKHNCMVDVFSVFQENHIMALIYSPSAAGNNNGNGWMKVRAKELIPEQYFDGNSGFISKSYRTRIKDRLTLVNATWMASDGKCLFRPDQLTLPSSGSVAMGAGALLAPRRGIGG